MILGRILAGYLDEHASEFTEFDLMVPSPTFTGPGAVRDWDHIRVIVEAASLESSLPWPFDLQTPPTIAQTVLTERFASQSSWQHRRQLAEGPFRAALSVPHPGRVEGKSILVFDDIFTDGLRTREVASSLLGAGAQRVSQIVLARRVFGGEQS